MISVSKGHPALSTETRLSASTKASSFVKRSHMLTSNIFGGISYRTLVDPSRIGCHA